MGYEWLVFVVVCFWVIVSLFFIIFVKYFGFFVYSCWCMGCIFVILIIIVFFSGGWLIVYSSVILVMMLLGFIGIFIGDIVFFVCLNCMGLR